MQGGAGTHIRHKREAFVTHVRGISDWVITRGQAPFGSEWGALHLYFLLIPRGHRAGPGSGSKLVISLRSGGYPAYVVAVIIAKPKESPN